MSQDGITRHIRPGDVVVVAQVLGEPTALIEELFSRAGELAGVTLFVGMSVTGVLTRVPPGVELVSSVGMAPNSDLIAAGRMRLVPCHMSQLPWLLTEGPLRADVALVLLSPPDADGYCSLGVTSDYAWPAVQAAPVVLAEINDNVPVIAGDTRVHVSQLAQVVRTSRPLPEYHRATPADLELRIAQHVATYIRDGSCLQIGFGRLGEAVLQSVADRRDLGVHAGMVGDTILEMMRDGVITNARKGSDDITADGRGRLFAGSVPRQAGTAGRLYLIDVDGSAAVLADDVLISNGLGADPDDRLLYHVDSERRTVWRFALDAPDIGGSRQAYVSTSEYGAALPDGLAVAADGSVWVALAGAGLVVGWDAGGARLAEIAVPHALVTSVCFGGPGLRTLYILTGTDASHPNPDGGSVFATVAPRTGLPAPAARVRIV